jgi:hypothetical protein
MRSLNLYTAWAIENLLISEFSPDLHRQSDDHCLLKVSMGYARTYSARQDMRPKLDSEWMSEFDYLGERT